jgi:hypothetical protein
VHGPNPAHGFGPSGVAACGGQPMRSEQREASPCGRSGGPSAAKSSREASR